ncbi:MAG: A/G-specific adenine glycosylase [Patescibacteria group bacterium]
MLQVSPTQIKPFQKTVWEYYRKHKRSFPWRETTDPYKIMVSEIMLQQTQAERVVPKFNAFIKRFPTVKSLAQAPLSEVLTLWQGLGYNRRALFLKRAAEEVVSKHSGKIPATLEALDALPGIGPYTAGAILAFAFNKPTVFIETNIRTVFIHHFFKKARGKIADEKLLPLITTSLDRKRPRDYYSALMDYGSHLKMTLPNPSRKSTTHTKQSTFKGSHRELRGQILKHILVYKKVTINSLRRQLSHQKTSDIVETINELDFENFIKKHKRYISIVS